MDWGNCWVCSESFEVLFTSSTHQIRLTKVCLCSGLVIAEGLNPASKPLENFWVCSNVNLLTAIVAVNQVAQAELSSTLNNTC